MGNLPTITHKRIGFRRQCQEKWRGESQSDMLSDQDDLGRDNAIILQKQKAELNTYHEGCFHWDEAIGNAYHAGIALERFLDFPVGPNLL
jgi:hypothetical protein